jgi:hypothetical protein
MICFAKQIDYSRNSKRRDCEKDTNTKSKSNNIPQRTSSQASAKYIEFELAMASTAFYTFHSYSRYTIVF